MLGFIRGTIGGLIAGLLGAYLWASFALKTDFRISWIAIGIGIAVGLTFRAFSLERMLGPGGSFIYGLVAAAIALLSCAAGDLLYVILGMANELNISRLEAIARIDYKKSREIIESMMTLKVGGFYFIAAFVAYKAPTQFIEDDKDELNEGRIHP